ncbi:AtuA-related protein [Streptomyces yanii]|uniref:AtuA-related protein n=1 Tax=Streptomyces yanii TaxID=78510 RepID=UPI00406B9EBC
MRGTEASVRAVYDPITKGAITRYEVPGIGALNFVLEEVLEGGRSRTIAIEESGQVLSSLVRTVPIQSSPATSAVAGRRWVCDPLRDLLHRPARFRYRLVSRPPRRRPRSGDPR